MRLARTVAGTLLACRMSYPTGSIEEPTHSLIARLTGLRSAKRVAQIERGSEPSVHELRQIAAAFELDVAALFEIAGVDHGTHLTPRSAASDA